MNEMHKTGSLPDRVQAVRDALAAQSLDALIIFDPHNIRYLCGFTGEDSCLVVRPEEIILVSDFRFRLQARAEAPLARLLEVDDTVAKALPEALTGLSGEVGVESSFLTLARWADVDEALAHMPHRPVKGVVEKQREVKSPDEIDRCRAAGELAAQTMAQLTRMRVVGRTEREVALEMEMWARQRGSGPMPFDYIVAAGPRGAMPHGVASHAVIQPRCLLVVDIGVALDGYTSDMTRTFATGPLTSREQEMYEVVLAAQEKGRAAATHGAAAVEVDRAARAVIEAAGMGDLFRHSLGHGVGLEVHEAPRLGPRSKDTLAAGNVVTVEPGVYVDGLGGVRIEDTVAVTSSTCEVLTELERELIELS